jgi:hypothetical protein
MEPKVNMETTIRIQTTTFNHLEALVVRLK